MYVAQINRGRKIRVTTPALFTSGLRAAALIFLRDGSNDAATPAAPTITYMKPTNRRKPFAEIFIRFPDHAPLSIESLCSRPVGRECAAKPDRRGVVFRKPLFPPQFSFYPLVMFPSGRDPCGGSR
jgi:hypothetical protein